MSAAPPNDDLDPTREAPRRGGSSPGGGESTGAGNTESGNPEPAVDPGPPPEHPRYIAGDVLGIGGQGVVWRVHDRALGRDVALKTMRPEKISPEVVERFLREASATAVLEHPNIVPIYDVGQLADGRPFYTMRLVPGRSFRDVLKGLRDDEISDRTDPEWSLVRLLQVVQQASLALQFAHERGVVHRDVKPANLLLGDHGEVLLVDWGIAKIAGAGGPQTTTGVALGTVYYMSPEQARGERVDSRTDVYAIGVLLYECLSLRLPHDEASYGELVAAILRDVPVPPERRTHRLVPPELSALSQRAMAKRRDERLAAARDVHDQLQAFIEGVADRTRRTREAGRLTEEGLALLRLHEGTLGELAEARAVLEALASEHPSWQPLEEKRPLFLARRRTETLERRSRGELLQAIHRLTDALAHAPDHAAARAVLADVFLQKLRGSERERDEGMAEVWLSLVERFHDGAHARELAGRGSLRLRIHPDGAAHAVHRLVEDDIALVDGPIVATGRGDVEIDGLDMGSYVVVASADGFEPVRYPVAISRNTDWKGELRLLPTGSIPEGFVHVPGTEAWLGGDAQAISAWPLRRASVESFLIAKLPVTFQEWCGFLDALPPEQAALRIPRTESLGPLCERREGRFHPAGVSRVIAPWTKERFGDDCAWRVPVMGVCLEDAEEYCRFVGERLRRIVRLPTAEEWELAARGVDQRIYPWGNRFDAAACHGRESTSRQPDVAPVGSAAMDCSVYGVRDIAGGMLTLTGSSFTAGSPLIDVRGGSWQAASAFCRSASRQVATDRTRTAHVGIRLVAVVT